MIKNFIERWSRNRDHLRKVLSSCKRKNSGAALQIEVNNIVYGNK